MSYCVKKTKESKINKHKKKFKKFQKWTIYIFIFLPNNVLTRLFKEFKKKRKKNAYKKERKKKRMTINNIEIIYVRIIVCILMYIF